ncbi:LacI family DNA-binding transcriptional regulator [Modestobacter sp. VKM Ac-2983]|uniref:LacI family DNA-binding transcriptional regulator n=1 Tax=Modestobacter sp. VKM Ac-2983 TaxID=3004137 RepID=UPI0022ABAAC0|nr:LacI family DNA-binding transcriptional regulator [Modestobacter sp. VKM Ac-2983]MCZ2805742.1 LacI family DNA-binding transcriptional regulator [Modestobacter sp. VKM Ac-2983]
MPRKPTMPDVARAAGVSAMTVSYVYNKPDRVAPDTQRRVLEAADELGYAGPNAAARNLRRGRTGNIGVVLGERLSYAFADPQATVFLAGVAEVCAEHGLGLTLIPVTGDESDVGRVQQVAVDAFIVWTTTDDDPVLAAVRTSGLPAVVHGGPAVEGLHLVAIDDRAAAAAVAAIGLRHATAPAVISFPLNRDRRPQLLLGPDPQTATYPVTRARLAGYRDAVRSAGLDWASTPVLVLARNDRAEATRALDQLPATTDTVLAMSDELALGALDAPLLDTTRFAVTGWDYSPTAPGLTTVVQSLRDQGSQCARLVVGDPPGPPPAWNVITRSSTPDA